MSSRLRSLDSKISFFAFADIITAVSGVLIFVALLLATDLGRPTDSNSQTANPEIEQRLQDTLAQQLEVNAQNLRLQELLATAETSPNSEKIQADIATLQAQLSDAQKQQAALADQMTASQATIIARDNALGLAGLKATVQSVMQEAETITIQMTKARGVMAKLEQQVAQQQSMLLKLHQRDGQLWMIPDKTSTSKEPILVTVSGAGVTIEHFDQPDQRKELEIMNADTAFEAYLHGAKSLNQYVVFLVRPSGISTFQDLVKSARDLGFDVGFDALEEDRQIHFSTPLAVDEPMPQTDTPGTPPAQTGAHLISNSNSPANTTPAATPPKPNQPLPATAPAPPTQPKEKGWWQRFLEWAGFA